MSVAAAVGGLRTAIDVVQSIRRLRDARHDVRGFTLTQSRAADEGVERVSSILEAAVSLMQADPADLAREELRDLLACDSLGPITRRAIAQRLAYSAMAKAGL